MRGLPKAFYVTLDQMIILFLFMAIGYFFKKRNVLPDSMSLVMSKLEIYIFLPALSFKTFSANFTVSMFAEKGLLVLLSLGILTICFAIAVILAHRFSGDKATQAVYIYALTIPNLGYLGYPLVAADRKSVV